MQPPRFQNNEIEDAVIITHPKEMNHVDNSDNFLQRAVDRLEGSKSGSKIQLFVYIVAEVLWFKKTPNN